MDKVEVARILLVFRSRNTSEEDVMSLSMLLVFAVLKDFYGVTEVNIQRNITRPSTETTPSKPKPKRNKLKKRKPKKSTQTQKVMYQV